MTASSDDPGPSDAPSAETRDDLRARAHVWLAGDPDPVTRAALEVALRRDDEAELARGFARPLTFGTAGLRGPVGFGPGRMNLALVLRTSHALAVFLEENSLAERPVLVGFDGRPESAPWALAAASVHRAFGQEVFLFDRPGPTPWVSFGARHTRAAAGVVITPSHNPRGDAGYKLFDDWGIQIVGPWDARIAELLERAPPANAIARGLDPIAPPPPDVLASYEIWTDSLARAGREGDQPRPRERIGYTPLHGVGREASVIVAARNGFELVVVAEQAEIDGTFPTTPFPNPEEPGVLDALAALLEFEGLDLGVAHDPDADRFAVVAPRVGADEARRPLSGDQLGLLFADLWLDVLSEEDNDVEPLLVSTVVSSPGLDDLARERGARVERTLTGFKWLCRPALDDPRFAFAYEEALGYCFARPSRDVGEPQRDPTPRGPTPRVGPWDKDGVSALAVLFGRLAHARLEGESPGRFVARRLAELARRIGLWVSVGHSLRLEGGSDAARELVARLRRDPPERWGSTKVKSVVDYREGASQRSPYLGAQDLLVFELEGGGRVCVRPSGTEPKLKFYVHERGELEATRDYAAVEDALVRRAEQSAVALEAFLLDR